VTAEDAAAFPDDGYLRIVPDKNEQHTFKERMRTICGFCLMDLRFQPADANKIRTNKNYSPSRGETNQYIIYSDAIRALTGDDEIYQVVAEDQASAAITPSVYLRQGANIQGPFTRENGKPMENVSPLAPDSDALHSLSFQGQEYLIYWPKAVASQPENAEASPVKEEAPVAEKKETPAPEMKDAPAPAAAEAPAAPLPAAQLSTSAAPTAVRNTYVYKGNGQFEKVTEPAPAPAVDPMQTENAYQQIQDMNVAPSENANRLHASPSAPVSFMAEQPQKPLTGTRLYQAPQRQAAPKRAHNPLMEAVDQQRYAAKYEAPGAVLPQNAELKDVVNPVDAFKRALQGLWLSTDAQQQAVDVLLSQPRMKALLSKAMASDGRDATLAAMKTQLQDLEAERLVTLMQLDDAKKNLAAFKEEALADLTRDQKKKVDELNQAQQQAQKALENAQQSLEPLNAQCREAAEKLADMQKPLANSARVLFLSPAAGKSASGKELIDRVEKSMKAAGFRMQSGDALEMLTAYALSDGILEMRAENESDARAAYDAFANALGCKIHESRWNWCPCVLETGDAPLFVHFSDEKHPLVTSVYIASTRDDYDDYCKDEHYHAYPSLIAEPSLDAIPQPLPSFSPVSKACILKEMIKDAALNQETLDQIKMLRTAIADAGRALSLDAVKSICSFIACTQNDLPGGVAEAIDRAVCAYAVPHIQMYKLPADELKNLLAAMPRTLKALNIA